MIIKPDLKRLMKREIYTFLTISAVIILITFIIHALVVNLDPEVSNADFVHYVWPWIIGAVILLWVIAPWIAYLWIINLSYAIEDERVVIHKGIITKKSVSIPYRAITDFTLSRSLYERWLEIGTLLIQTAGQGAQPGSNEGRLVGLIDFDAIHNQLRERVKDFKHQRPAPSGAEATQPDQDVLQEILEEIRKINRKLN